MRNVGFGIAEVALIAMLFHPWGWDFKLANYGPSLVGWIVYEWNLPQGAMSHGWLIPFVSAYFAWTRRKDIAAAPKAVFVPGLIALILALVLQWIGFKTQQPRVSAIALIGVLWSVPLYVYGPAVGRLLLFPCAYFLFAVPMTFLDSLTFSLKLFSSATSAILLNGIGVAVTRTGTAIFAADGSFGLEVADPCSGLRSVLALAALTAAYAQFGRRTTPGKWILFLSALPLAVIGNIGRIVSVGIFSRLFGSERAMSIYHHYSGFLVFAFAVVLMIAEAELIGKLETKWSRKCNIATGVPT
jgi:exosortase